MSAVSTSWYRKAGTSDDWMITPTINVDSRHAVLRWDSKSGDKDYRDGYAVYISESGSAPSDFKDTTPAFTIQKESEEWTSHELSLAQYAGKSVRVAFVNNSNDCHTLYVDNLFVGIPAILEITSLIDPIINEEGFVKICGEVKNIGTSDVDGFTVRYQLGSEGVKEKTIPGIVKGGTVKRFEFDTECYIHRDETLNYVLTVMAGDDISDADGIISCYYRKIVAEEVTGTWCGYCVRGIVSMRDMKEKYSDTFIGIAVHGSSPSWEDPMDYGDYSNYLFESMGMPGYPHATVNRRKLQTGDPGNIERYYSQLMAQDLIAATTLKVDSYDKDSRLMEIHTDIHFAKNIDNPDFGIAYVLIENDVCNHEPGTDKNGNPSIYNGWEQNNYYSGGDNGEMGGFESLPPRIPGTQIVYQDVARAFWGDGFGTLPNSLPLEKAEAYKTYTHEYSVTLPDNVLNDRNTELAALLINRKTGEIVNADAVSLNSSGISSIVRESPAVEISVNDGIIKVTSDSMIHTLTIYTAGGVLVGQENIMGFDAEVNTGLPHGLYVVMALTGKGSYATKVII